MRGKLNRPPRLYLSTCRIRGESGLISRPDPGDERCGVEPTAQRVGKMEYWIGIKEQRKDTVMRSVAAAQPPLAALRRRTVRTEVPFVRA